MSRRAVALAVVVMLSACGSPESLDCARATRGATDDVTVDLCRREYADTRDPRIGARLANALRRTSKLDEASAIANEILSSEARSDALQILGKIAVSRGDLNSATASLESARLLHTGELRLAQVATDTQALAGIFVRQNRFGEALRALDECIGDSRAAGDTLIEGYCHMSAGDVLGTVGYFEGAQREFELARPMLTKDRDLASLALERGSLDQYYAFGWARRESHAAAVAEFEQAVKYARQAGLATTERAAQLNVVYSLAELGRTDEAAQRLATVRALDRDNADADDRTLLEARVEYHRGNYDRARALHATIYDRLSLDDNRLRVCVLEGRMALAARDYERAVLWARRGVELSETMRGAQSALELRSWVLSTRRQPHEILFTALARAHRFEDALLAFDRWQGRTLLDALARDRSGKTDLRTAAMNSETLRRAFPALSRAPVATTTAPEVLTGLRDVDVVALLAAEERVWRIDAYRGAVAIVDLGSVAEWQSALTRFQAAATNPEPELGDRLLGAQAFRETSDALLVILDAHFAATPIAALRHAGRPLVAYRPVVHAPRLSETRCVPEPVSPPRAIVLGDPRQDLPAARREAEEVAAALGATPLIGAPAKRDALFAARAGDLLHVAGHARVDVGGGALVLSDESVSALEISARGGAPAFVMLSTCDSAAATDGEQATSLATAYLAGGSAHVIATLRPVTDASARELAVAFYRAGGIKDPARTLARVQADLARTGNTDWPSFALFGHDTCRKDRP